MAAWAGTTATMARGTATTTGFTPGLDDGPGGSGRWPAIVHLAGVGDGAPSLSRGGGGPPNRQRQSLIIGSVLCPLMGNQVAPAGFYGRAVGSEIPTDVSIAEAADFANRSCLLSPVRLVDRVKPRRPIIGTTSAAGGTRGVLLVADRVELGHRVRRSAPIMHAAGEPTLPEVCLCTPQKATTPAHSVDCCPLQTHPHSGRGGFVGSCLFIDFDLVVGEPKRPPACCFYGPEELLGPSEAAAEPMDSREVARAVEISLSGPEDTAPGESSPRVSPACFMAPCADSSSLALGREQTPVEVQLEDIPSFIEAQVCVSMQSPIVKGRPALRTRATLAHRVRAEEEHPSGCQDEGGQPNQASTTHVDGEVGSRPAIKASGPCDHGRI